MCEWVGGWEKICVCVCENVCITPPDFLQWPQGHFCIKRIKEVSLGGREVCFIGASACRLYKRLLWTEAWLACCVVLLRGKRRGRRERERRREGWWLAARCLGWRQNSSLINVMRRVVGLEVLSQVLNTGLPSTSSLPASVGVAHVMFSVYEPLLWISVPPNAAPPKHGCCMPAWCQLVGFKQTYAPPFVSD